MSAAFTDFYVRTTGNNLNAGSTNTDAAAHTYASGTWVQATRVFTPTSGNPQSDGVAVGDFCSVYPDATSPDAVYISRVTAVSTIAITLSSTALSGTAPANGATNTTLKHGGAWATAKFAISFPAAAMTDSAGDQVRVNFSAETHATATAMTRSTAGPITFSGAGVGSTVISGGTSGASYTLLAISNNVVVFENMTMQNNGSTGSADGVTANSRIILYNVRITGMCGFGLNATVMGGDLLEIDGNNANNTAAKGGLAIAGACTFDRLSVHDNAGSNNVGIVVSASNTSVNISRLLCASNGKYGIQITGNMILAILGGDVFNNGSFGLFINGAVPSIILENVNFVSNTTNALNADAGTPNFQCREVNCGFFSNGTDTNAKYDQFAEVTGRITYASSPYVSAGTGSSPRTGNFAAAASIGAKNGGSGPLLQNSGNFSTTTTSQPDVGAFQTSGGGATLNRGILQGGIL